MFYLFFIFVNVVITIHIKIIWLLVNVFPRLSEFFFFSSGCDPKSSLFERKILGRTLSVQPRRMNSRDLKYPPTSPTQFNQPNSRQRGRLLVNSLSWPKRYCVHKYLPLDNAWPV
jgi:hypothetical protein